MSSDKGLLHALLHVKKKSPGKITASCVEVPAHHPSALTQFLDQSTRQRLVTEQGHPSQDMLRRDVSRLWAMAANELKVSLPHHDSHRGANRSHLPPPFEVLEKSDPRLRVGIVVWVQTLTIPPVHDAFYRRPEAP